MSDDDDDDDVRWFLVWRLTRGRAVRCPIPPQHLVGDTRQQDLMPRNGQRKDTTYMLISWHCCVVQELSISRARLALFAELPAQLDHDDDDDDDDAFRS